MKKQQAFYALIMLSILVLNSGCATIMNKTSVVLYGYTDNMKVSDNGVPLEVEQTYVATGGTLASQSVTYYGAGIKLKRTKADHVITLDDGSKKVDVVMKSKFAMGTLFADLFFAGGPLGILIDVIAGPLRHTKEKYIDVQGELGNKKKESKHKLKNDFKKSFKN